MPPLCSPRRRRDRGRPTAAERWSGGAEGVRPAVAGGSRRGSGDGRGAHLGGGPVGGRAGPPGRAREAGPSARGSRPGVRRPPEQNWQNGERAAQVKTPAATGGGRRGGAE